MKKKILAYLLIMGILLTNIVGSFSYAVDIKSDMENNTSLDGNRNDETIDIEETSNSENSNLDELETATNDFKDIEPGLVQHGNKEFLESVTSSEQKEAQEEEQAGAAEKVLGPSTDREEDEDSRRLGTEADFEEAWGKAHKENLDRKEELGSNLVEDPKEINLEKIQVDKKDSALKEGPGISGEAYGRYVLEMRDVRMMMFRNYDPKLEIVPSRALRSKFMDARSTGDVRVAGSVAGAVTNVAIKDKNKSENSIKILGSISFADNSDIKIGSGDTIELGFGPNPNLDMATANDRADIYLGTTNIKIAEAKIDRNGVTIVFNENADKVKDLSGSVVFGIDFKHSETSDKSKSETISIGGKEFEVPPKNNSEGGTIGEKIDSDEVTFSKYGTESNGKILWTVRLNGNGASINAFPTKLSGDLIIKDEIINHGLDHRLIEDSVYIYIQARDKSNAEEAKTGIYGKSDGSGETLGKLKSNFGLELKVNLDKGVIELETDRAESLNDYDLALHYETEVLNYGAEKYMNDANIKYTEDGKNSSTGDLGIVENAFIGGDAGGRIPQGLLKIQKTVEGKPAFIEGIKFKIQNLRDSREYLLETDKYGVAQLNGLIAGDWYRIKEISLPNEWSELLDLNIKTFDIQADHYKGIELEVDNKYKDGQDKINIDVKKVWSTGSPGAQEVSVRLLAGKEQVATATLSEKNGWKHSFEGLARYSEFMSEIDYSVEELEVEGYDSKVSGNSETGFTITNTPKDRKISLVKKWFGEIREGVEGITVYLTRETERISRAIKISKANNWEKVIGLKDVLLEGFKDTDIKDIGLEEEKLDGYSSKITGNIENGFVITNTKEEVVEAEKLDLKVEKKWAGIDYSDVKDRSVFIQLARRLEGETDFEYLYYTLDLNHSNGFKGSFTDLDKYDEAGRKIEYSVVEPGLDDNFEVSITGNMDDGFVVTNSLKTVRIKIEKKWEGFSGGKVPYWAKYVEFEVSRKTEANGKSEYLGNVQVPRKEACACDTMEKTIEKEFPKTNAEGEEYIYELKELEDHRYDSEVKEVVKEGDLYIYEVINRPRPKTDIKVRKTWGGGIVDGLDSIGLTLKRKDSKEPVAKITMTRDDFVEQVSSTIYWEASFSNIDQYDENGSEIEYYVEEDMGEFSKYYYPPSMDYNMKEDGFSTEYYTSVKDPGNKGIDVKNLSNNVEPISPDGPEISFEKKWFGGIREGIEEITVYLTKESKKISEAIKISAKDKWKKTVRLGSVLLDGFKDTDIKDIEVVEEKIQGYTSKIEGDSENGFIIKNKRIPEKPTNPGPKDPEKPNEGPKDPEKPSKPNKPSKPSKPEEPREERPEEPREERPEEPREERPEEPREERPEEPREDVQVKEIVVSREDEDKPRDDIGVKTERLQREEDTRVAGAAATRQKKLLPKTGVKSGKLYSVFGGLMLILGYLLTRKK